MWLLVYVTCDTFVCLVFRFIVCLISSFRYNRLVPLALAAFGRVRALWAHGGPKGLHKGGGDISLALRLHWEACHPLWQQ